MPPRGVTKIKQAHIDACVERYRNGEQVAVLAKYYKMSVGQIYNWINAADAGKPSVQKQLERIEVDIRDIYRMFDQLKVIKPAKPVGTPKWRCPTCHGTNVQISLPTWYTETDRGVEFVETDSEANVSWYYCPDCEASDDGEPERIEAE